jgi:hypothetical protein
MRLELTYNQGMRYKIILLLFLSSLLGCSPTEKRPADSVMYGFRIPVKKVVSNTYKKIILKNGEWVPEDSSAYSNSLIYYYNKEGNLDSLIHIHSLPSGKKIHRSMIHEYANGVKISAKVYRDGLLDEVHTYTWNDKYTFTQKAVDSKNKPILTITVKLSDLFQEIYGVSINYDENKEIVSHSKSEFIRNPAGWVTGKSDNDLLEKKTSNYKYIHRKYDHKNTPIQSEEWLAGDSMPSKVYIREVEYYNN